MRFRSRKEGSALHWKPKNGQCVVTKEAKQTDKQYVFDRVFNEKENNKIVYQGKLHLLLENQDRLMQFALSLFISYRPVYIYTNRYWKRNN